MRTLNIALRTRSDERVAKPLLDWAGTELGVVMLAAMAADES